MLTDRMWCQVQDFFGQRVPQPGAWTTGGFLINALDNLSGSERLDQCSFTRANFSLSFYRGRRSCSARSGTRLSRSEQRLAGRSSLKPSSQLAQLQQGQILPRCWK